MNKEDVAHKLRLLATYLENMRELEKHIALYGMAPPIELINQYKFHQRSIEELQNRISVLTQDVSSDELRIKVDELSELISTEVERHRYIWQEEEFKERMKFIAKSYMNLPFAEHLIKYRFLNFVQLHILLVMMMTYVGWIQGGINSAITAAVIVILLCIGLRDTFDIEEQRAEARMLSENGFEGLDSIKK